MQNIDHNDNLLLYQFIQNLPNIEAFVHDLDVFKHLIPLILNN